jgi:hypothetical protein
MDQIKQLGDLGRNHYEKIIMILALIGVGAAVFYLYGASQEEKRKLDDLVQSKRVANVAGVQPVNLTNFWKAEAILDAPPPLKFTTPHNLFNPVKWQKKPDKTLLKIQNLKDIGPYALSIAALRPLYLTIALDRAAGNGYWMVVTNGTENPRGRNYRINQFATLTSTNTKVFVLREVKSPEDPANTEYVLELKDSAEKVTLTAAKPYQRVQGYEADLRYEVEGKTFDRIREGSQLRLSGENYNIVAIKPDEVLLSADSNDRRYSIKLNGAP